MSHSVVPDIPKFLHADDSLCPVYLKVHFDSLEILGSQFLSLRTFTMLPWIIYARRKVLLFKHNDGLILFLLYIVCSFCLKDSFFVFF